MPDITVNIEVYCGKCGAGLCHGTEFVTTRLRQEPSFRVQPCEKCMEESREEGYAAGYQEARDQLEE